MKRESTRSSETDPDMEPEYDFSGGVRGKYHERFQKMRLKVAIDPDVARTFPTSVAVNEALRTLQRIGGVQLVPKATTRRRKAG